MTSSTKRAIEKPWEIFNKERLPKPEECKYTHVSLFTGCGGIDLGFRAAGFKTIFANDIFVDAIKTHRANLGEITEGDIRTLKFPRNVKGPDVLSAGFPCQPFSNAGLRKGVDDARGDLYLSALRAVRELKPKTVLFENVRGLLSSRHNGKRLIEIIVENLDSLGYDSTFCLVDASKHNVPSRRHRVLIVGVRRKSQLGRFSFPDESSDYDLTLKSVLSDLPADLPNENDCVKVSPQLKYMIERIPEGGSWKDVPYDQLPDRLKKIADNNERYHSPKFYRRFSMNDVAGTMTAAFTAEKAGIIHPKKNRPFSVREVARIQTFPDWFALEGTNPRKMFQQLGNAVPPRLAYEVGKQLVAVLEGKDLLKGKGFLDFESFKELAVVKDSDPQVVALKGKMP